MDKTILYCSFCPHCAESAPRGPGFANDDQKKVWHRLHLGSRRHRWWWWLKKF